VKRREFIALTGGAAAAWSLAALAQQASPQRRIGVLMNASADDLESQGYVAAFREGLEKLGWLDGRDLRIDVRWGGSSAERTRYYAAELAALGPDLIVAAGGPVMTAVRVASRTVPIVFSQAIDPVGSGQVASLARPGGNATGFMQFEYGLAGKWPQLLRELMPGLKRIAIVRDPGNPAGIGQWAVIQTAATALGLEVIAINIRDAAEIERGMADFARDEGGGLIIPVSGIATNHRQRLVEQAAQHKLPAIYPYRSFAAAGGLISYGPDLKAQYRLAAGYAHRILKGENPGNLPVQAPAKYDLVINMKTAKALKLTVAPALLVRADELIE
jgi:putative ABC transport system substrate-binding protein